MKMTISTAVSVLLLVMAATLGTVSPRSVFAVSACQAILANGGSVADKKCVRKRDVGNSAIDTKNLTNDAVTSIKVEDNSLTGADVQNSSLTGADVLDNSITGADVQNSSLTGADVLDNSLSSLDLGTNSVGQSEIQTSGVASAEVLDNSLTANDLGPNSVGQSEIATSGVASSEVLNNSLTNADVQNNSLFDVDIADEAGGDFSGGNQLLTLTPTDVTARLVTITAPTSGRVIVNASGYFDFNETATTDRDSARCSITTGLTVDFSNLIIAAEQNTTDEIDFMPFAGTRGFSVNTGSTTFRLVCDEFDGNVQVGDSHITAIFVPTAY